MADPDVKAVLTSDHAELYEPEVARRYFAKFGRITGHLPRVAAELEREGRLTRLEARLIGGYVQAVAASFQALSLKYLMTGRDAAAGRLTFDRHESGFPVAQELMVMANDAQQAARHLTGVASEAELKDRMIRQIVGDLAVPSKLQFALSQRLYYEALQAGGLFWARNDPDAQWLEDRGERRAYLVHWAVYDSQINLPVVWLLELEDSGRTALPNDDRRWPEARAHLMAVNTWGANEADGHIAEAFMLWRRRSQLAWELDLSILTSAGVELRNQPPAGEARREAARQRLDNSIHPPTASHDDELPERTGSG